MFLRESEPKKDQDTNVNFADRRELRLVSPPRLQPPATAFRLLTASSACPNFATGEQEKNRSVTHVRRLATIAARTSLRSPVKPSSTSDTRPLYLTQLRWRRARLGSFRLMWSSQLRLQTMAPSVRSPHHHRQTTLACKWLGISIQEMSAH